MSNVVDRLISQKILRSEASTDVRYSTDVEAALTAAGEFTRSGGNVRLLKTANHVWEATAWVGKSRQHTELGPFASALCRAMLAAVGVSVKSSDE